jgi:hypothetical protein
MKVKVVGKFRLQMLYRSQKREIERLTKENDEWKAARQKVRDGFKHESRIDGNCQCCYCRRDMDALCDHAADYEMKWFSAQPRAEALEAALRPCLEFIEDEAAVILECNSLGDDPDTMEPDARFHYDSLLSMIAVAQSAL